MDGGFEDFWVGKEGWLFGFLKAVTIRRGVQGRENGVLQIDWSGISCEFWNPGVIFRGREDGFLLA